MEASVRPVDGPLPPEDLTEIVAQVRAATRATAAALNVAVSEDRSSEAPLLYRSAGFEAIGPDLFLAPGTNPASTPIYLSHSSGDRDAAVLRPLGWRAPAGDGEVLRELLLDTIALPTGGYALVRIRDRDLLLFLEHIATSHLDRSEVATALASARSAGFLCGVDDPAVSSPPQSLPPDVIRKVDEFLLRRPLGWARRARGDGEQPAWIREGDPPLAAHLHTEHGILTIGRGLRPFLGNVPLDAAERLLRANVQLLHGSVAALRDGSQGDLILLHRLFCRDLDESELERSVSYLERLRVAWARTTRSAIELLGALERSAQEAERSRKLESNAPLIEAEVLSDEVMVGQRDDGEALTLPISDFLTHAFVCGGTGSGKTIVCKNLIEELALAGVPSIVIDLKGDLSSLACIPDGSSEAEISAYLVRLYGDAAAHFSAAIARSAKHAAERYREHGTNAAALEHLRSRVCHRILTPRSDVGIPFSLSPLGRVELGSIGATSGIVGNRELHE